MTDGIKVNNLSLTAGDKLLLDKIELTVEAGNAFCLLGKSPAKRLLLKLVAAGHSDRAMYVDDFQVVSETALSNDVCLITEGKNLWGFLRVVDYAKYCLMSGKYYKFNYARLRAELQIVGLIGKMNVRLKKLSPVELMLLEIALQSCKNRNKIVVCADNLEYSKQDYIKLNIALESIKKYNRSVIIALRDARLVGSGFDKIGVLDGNQVILQGAPEQIRNVLSSTCYSIKPTGNLKALAAKIQEINGGGQIKINGGRLQVYADSEDAAKEIVKALADSGEGLVSYKLKQSTLADSLKKAKIS